MVIQKAVILAGGLGTRLMEETETRPKPMVEIGGKPILWHIMRMYHAHGINEFIICLGYKGYVIKEWFQNYYLHTSDVTFNLGDNQTKLLRTGAEPWRVTLVETGADTMTGGRLKRVQDYVGHEPFCFTYGDAVSTVDIRSSIAFHTRHGRSATVTAVLPQARFGMLDIQNGAVLGFQEKPKELHQWINGGFFILEPTVFDLIDGDSTVWEREPMERLSKSGQLMAFQHEGFWQPMDTLREKRLLEDLWSAGKAPWKSQ